MLFSPDSRLFATCSFATLTAGSVDSLVLRWFRAHASTFCQCSLIQSHGPSLRMCGVTLKITVGACAQRLEDSMGVQPLNLGNSSKLLGADSNYLPTRDLTLIISRRGRDVVGRIFRMLTSRVCEIYWSRVAFNEGTPTGTPEIVYDPLLKVAALNPAMLTVPFSIGVSL